MNTPNIVDIIPTEHNEENDTERTSRYAVEIDQQSGSLTITDKVYSTIPPVNNPCNFNKSFHRKVNDIILCIANHQANNINTNCRYELNTEKGYIGSILINKNKDKHDGSSIVTAYYKTKVPSLAFLSTEIIQTQLCFKSNIEKIKF